MNAPRDWTRIRPYPEHRLFARVVAAVDDHELALGLVLPPARHLHPREMPIYVRKRLIEYLRASFPVPPPALRNIFPTKREAEEARRVFTSLVRGGSTEGEALVTLGITMKYPASSIPEHAYATILRSSCNCLEEAGAPPGWDFLVGSTSGEPLDDPQVRAFWCWEFGLGAVSPAADRSAARQQHEARDRIRFADFSRLYGPTSALARTG